MDLLSALAMLALGVGLPMLLGPVGVFAGIGLFMTQSPFGLIIEASAALAFGCAVAWAIFADHETGTWRIGNE